MVENMDEKRVMAYFNAKIEELKVQNLENAKFLRGISRRIENELALIREENQDEMSDESTIIEGLERLEKIVAEIDNSVTGKVEKYGKDNTDRVIEDLENVGEECIEKLVEEMERIDTDSTQKIIEEIEKHDSGKNDNVTDAFERISVENTDRIIGEIQKINTENVERQNAENTEIILGTIERAVENSNIKILNGLGKLDTNEILKELSNIEALISANNANDVIFEINALRSQIQASSSDTILTRVERKIDAVSGNDSAYRLNEIKSILEAGSVKTDDIQSKIERVSSMPMMVKSVIQSENEKNFKEFDSHVSDMNVLLGKKVEGLRILVGISLWMSIMSVALMIANMLGLI